MDIRLKQTGYKTLAVGDWVRVRETFHTSTYGTMKPGILATVVKIEKNATDSSEPAIYLFLHSIDDLDLLGEGNVVRIGADDIPVSDALFEEFLAEHIEIIGKDEQDAPKVDLLYQLCQLKKYVDNALEAAQYGGGRRVEHIIDLQSELSGRTMHVTSAINAYLKAYGY